MANICASIVVLAIAFGPSSCWAITNRSARQNVDNGFYQWYQQLEMVQPLVYTEDNREYYAQYYTMYYANSYYQEQQKQQPQQDPFDVANQQHSFEEQPDQSGYPLTFPVRTVPLPIPDPFAERLSTDETSSAVYIDEDGLFKESMPKIEKDGIQTLFEGQPVFTD